MIEQSKGILAERLDVTIDTAFGLLRDHARNHNRRLQEIAANVVSGSLGADAITGVHLNHSHAQARVVGAENRSSERR